MTRDSALRPATANQVRAICLLARRRALDLAAELQKRYGVVRPADLLLVQASQMIDVLTASPEPTAESD